MFIEIAALLSIFQLICAGVSTNLLFSNSENLTDNISDDMKFKNIQDQLELRRNLSGEITSLGLDLNNPLSEQRNEIKDDLEELKAALAGTKQLLRTVESNDPGDFYLNDDIQKFPDEKTTKEPSKETTQSTKKNPTGDGDRKDECSSTAGPWMVIQRRQDGSVDFYRNWVDYKRGFGNLEGEFFIGLDKLHAITSSRMHELWIQMEDFEDGRRWAKYSTFAIGRESQGYILNVLGNYSGDAGDSMDYHRYQEWVTKDHGLMSYCAKWATGAWWYGSCHHSNLNGQYLKGPVSENYRSKGVIWNHWRGRLYPLKYVHMAIRPVPNRS